MLDLKSLAAQIDGLTAERDSLEQFEAWFLEHARGVHVWGDDLTVEVVQIVEGHFDEMRFGGLSVTEFISELKQTAAVFADMAKSLADVTAL